MNFCGLESCGQKQVTVVQMFVVNHGRCGKSANIIEAYQLDLPTFCWPRLPLETVG